MGFYIDSADLAVIGDLWQTGVFRGVTTNPTILARAGLSQADFGSLYGSLREMGIDTIYAQVLGTRTEQMLDSASLLLSLGELIVKVPASPPGLAAAAALSRDGVPVLLTAVHHPAQGVIARDLGLHGVAPYVGRMTDAGRDGVASVIRMQQAIGSEPTRILAASLRSLDDVAVLAAAGVPDFTIGETVARALVDDELTARAVADFERDADQVTAARE